MNNVLGFSPKLSPLRSSQPSCPYITVSLSCYFINILTECLFERNSRSFLPPATEPVTLTSLYTRYHLRSQTSSLSSSLQKEKKKKTSFCPRPSSDPCTVPFSYTNVSYTYLSSFSDTHIGTRLSLTLTTYPHTPTKEDVQRETLWVTFLSPRTRPFTHPQSLPRTPSRKFSSVPYLNPNTRTGHTDNPPYLLTSCPFDPSVINERRTRHWTGICVKEVVRKIT